MIDPRSRLGVVLTAALMLGTAVIPPSMTLMAAPGTATAGHHHEHHQAPGQSGNNCCDLCWTACGTAPGISRQATLPAVAWTEIFLARAATGATSTALPLPHRLPFAQGPPAFLS